MLPQNEPTIKYKIFKIHKNKDRPKFCFETAFVHSSQLTDGVTTNLRNSTGP